MSSVKTISRREMLQVLGGSAAALAAAPFAPVLPPPLDLEKLTRERPVLLVDSHNGLAWAFQEILDYENIHTIATESSLEAMEIWRSQLISALITDILFPRGQIDGYELIENWKTDPITSHLPFGFHTAMYDKKDRIKGMNMGAVAYIAKPVHAYEYIRTIRRILIRHVQW